MRKLFNKFIPCHHFNNNFQIEHNFTQADENTSREIKESPWEARVVGNPLLEEYSFSRGKTWEEATMRAEAIALRILAFQLENFIFEMNKDRNFQNIS